MFETGPVSCFNVLENKIFLLLCYHFLLKMSTDISFQHTWYPFTQRCSVIWRHPALMNETDFSYYKINWGKGIFDLEYRFIFTSTDTCIFNLFRFNWQILSLLQNIWNLSLTFLVTYLLIDNSETVIICMPLHHCVLFYW